MRRTLSTQARSAYRLNQVVSARVERIFPFGVFVLLPDGTPGYVRRRELTLAGTIDPQQVVSKGQTLKAVVIALPERGQKLELSVRRLEPDPWDLLVSRFQVRDTVTGTVKSFLPGGMFVEVLPGVDGFVPLSELAPWSVQKASDLYWVGDRVEAMITALDRPQKRLRLSIRQQMMHQARGQQLTGHLEAAEAQAEPSPEAGEPIPGDETVADLRPLGRVLVLDDHQGVREGLVNWLQRHHCQAVGAERPAEALDQIRHGQYGLALVDLDLPGQDGVEFIRALRQISPATRVILMSIPGWIAGRGHELEALQVVEVLAKPLNMEEVLDTLSRLARGEPVGPFRAGAVELPDEKADSFQKLAPIMRRHGPLEARLRAGLEELVRFARAEAGVLFRLHPISQQVSIVAQAGELPIEEWALPGLSTSPVKDLIVEGGEILESRMSEHNRRRFQKLLDALPFESCLGVPLSAAGRVEHALFLFHREPEAFSRYRLRDAHAMATLLAVALESQALEERIRTVGPFLLSGQLAAGFGHDVFNKMSALELQVRELKAACSASKGQAEGVRLDEPGGCGLVADSIERLLETILDLEKTVEAFRELIRAEEQQEVEVNQVVQRAILLVQALARRSRVQIKPELAPDLPPVAGSPIRLQQAFLNIMLNAIQHTGQKLETWPEGQGRLRITTGVDPDRQVVWVRFADTGLGIHHRLWDNIFALGFSTRPGGTGLGLFIARSLIESMGGCVCVEESLVPLGTTFLVELPVAMG